VSPPGGFFFPSRNQLGKNYFPSPGIAGAVVGALLSILSASVFALAAPLSMALFNWPILPEVSGIAGVAGGGGMVTVVLVVTVGMAGGVTAVLSLLSQPINSAPPTKSAAIRIDVFTRCSL
jgi:hypothetical protein